MTKLNLGCGDRKIHGFINVSAETLRSDLLKVGFQNVKIYDWRETEHFFVDDYSQAYLPHMDKANGKLMSLNIEAIK